MSPGAAHWQERLEELAETHAVPGASLAILDGGEIMTAAAGVLNTGTGVTTTPDSLFQVGSVTKVWTASLLMQAAEKGLLDLDAPLADVLPELVLADPAATGKITTRHLLSHSSGIDGDMFDDTGRGDDAVARYVARCRRLEALFPAGALMSYSNAGYVIAGRIAEVLGNATWDEILRRDLIEPLGLQRTVSLPEDALRFRAAFGHIGEDEDRRLAPAWIPSRGAGPAGAIMATATDVLTFASMHLDSGRGPDGTRILSPASVTAMQQPEIAVPGSTLTGGSGHRGLGWGVSDWDGSRVVGHDGGTLGQYSFLRLLPDSRAAVCLLTNGGQAGLLFHDLFSEVFLKLWDVAIPAPPELPDGQQPFDPGAYAGRYERESVRFDVEPAGAGLAVTVTNSAAFAADLPDRVEVMTLRPVAQDLFATRSSAAEPWAPVIFGQLPGGCAYLYFGGRIAPRRPPAAG